MAERRPFTPVAIRAKEQIRGAERFLVRAVVSGGDDRRVRWLPAPPERAPARGGEW